MLSKEFPGGILVLTGANSATGLRSMPARYIFLDEVDAYPSTCGALRKCSSLILRSAAAGVTCTKLGRTRPNALI